MNVGRRVGVVMVSQCQAHKSGKGRARPRGRCRSVVSVVVATWPRGRGAQVRSF